MSRRRKRLDKALATPGSLSFRELCRLAEDHGFTLDRTKGSHHVYVHPELGVTISFQERKGEAPSYQVRALLEALDEGDLI